MSTKLTKRLSYEAAAEAVAAMLDDVAFREAVLTRQKVTRGSASVEGDLVRVEQVRPSSGLPGFAQKLVGDEITIVQLERWTSPTTCDVELQIPGKPGEAVGTMRLVESGGATTQEIDLDLTVRIPLVGGKIEALVAGLFSKSLDIEQAVGREWLAR